MLETFTLKQNLDSALLELSQALYQHDAACRVIARLMKERDEARAQVAALSSQLAHHTGSISQASDSCSSTGSVEKSNQMLSEQGIDDEVRSVVQSKSQELSLQRKNRSISPELCVRDVFRQGLVDSCVSTSQTSSLLCASLSSDISRRQIMTGDDQGQVVVMDRNSKSVIYSRNAGKKVTSVAFHASEKFDIQYSGHADGVVNVSEIVLIIVYFVY